MPEAITPTGCDQSIVDIALLAQQAAEAGKKLAIEASDGSGYGRNGLTFDTAAEVVEYGTGLFLRWTACTGWRVIVAD